MNHRIPHLVCGAFALVLATSVAHAQPDVSCKSTETEAECHARLKCRASEDIEQCQARLRGGSANGNTGDDPGNAGRDDRGRDGRDGRDDRANDRANDRDNDRDNDRRDRNNDRNDRNDRGDDRRDDDRADRGDRGDRGRGNSGRRGRRNRGGSRDYVSDRSFGLGLEVGEPTGLTGKYFVSETGALDFGLGYVYGHYYYGDGIHLYGDYLWHPKLLTENATFQMPFYIGVGLRYWDFEYCDERICDYGGSALGVRVPIGISFDFNNAPIDIFLQLVPVLDFINGDYYDRYGDRSHFGVDVSAGIRFWF